MTKLPELPARVGVIGDVHAEDELLERALEHFAEVGIDVVLCTGDVADGPGSAQRCCELLESRGVLTVRGNHDRWLLAGEMRQVPAATELAQLQASAHAFLAALPAQRELDTLLGPLLLCHGLGSDDMAKVGPDDFGYALEWNRSLQTLLRLARFPWVVNGHSHRPMVRRLGAITLINAGTLRRDHQPCLLRLDFSAGSVEVVRFAAGIPGPTERIPLS